MSVDSSQPGFESGSCGPLRLEGNGLVLRCWTAADLPVMVELFDDPDIARWTPLPSPFTAADARARLLKSRRSDLILLAITTDGTRPLGEVMVTATGSMGYAVGADHRRQGMAARALLLLRDHAGASLGLRVLRLEIEPDNVASAAVARAAGFRLVPSGRRTAEGKGRRYVLDVWEHAPSASVSPS